MKKRLLCAALVLVLVAVLCGCSSSLSGDDKAAFDLIIVVSSEFKEPSSVRIIDGEAFGGVGLNCTLSATNGFGARTSSHYMVSAVGDDVKLIELNLTPFDGETNVNIEKINKAIEEHFGFS